ncbi:amiloride-sensitive sodium channel subunit alpha-like [Watersipora subatra]|uniref:amiloride-sensitive sodium channel subunit alpha-like n=1 Tax=Watersipora subatra TaxID=2589382 RepID=UPI00355BC9C2
MASEKIDGHNASSWITFTEKTTLHGVQYTTKESSPKRRIFWSVMILIGVGYFTWAAYLFLRDYSKQIVSTKIKIKNSKEMQFPTVTICNKNNWKSSAVFSPYVDNKTRKAVEDVLMDLYLRRDLPPPPGKYNWSDPIYLGLSKDTNISSERHEEEMKKMSHKLNETFISCQVLGVTKPCSEVLQPERTDAG